MKGLPGILAAGAAAVCFALAATPHAPGGGTPGGEIPEVPAGAQMSPRGFYLPYQFSSFADDTALYANAYRAAARAAGADSGAETEIRAESAGGGTGRVRAGTISHHLFIRNLIARYFNILGGRVHPGTIILIGPNHHARGHAPIAISALRWRTPFGFLEPDTARIRRIAGSGLARVEEEPFVNEHSIGALVPFIRRTFPGTRIVPIIFKKAAGRRDCVQLAEIIAREMDDAVVLGSLDFSHYKTSSVAVSEDSASLSVLRSLAGDRIDEAFVDSRPALLTLMSICRIMGAPRVEVVEHTNSGILSHNLRIPCTSYINTIIRN